MKKASVASVATVFNRTLLIRRLLAAAGPLTVDEVIAAVGPFVDPAAAVRVFTSKQERDTRSENGGRLSLDQKVASGRRTIIIKCLHNGKRPDINAFRESGGRWDLLPSAAAFGISRLVTPAGEVFWRAERVSRRASNESLAVGSGLTSNRLFPTQAEALEARRAHERALGCPW